MTNHQHQPEISMGAGSYAFSGHLTWTGVLGAKPPAAGGKVVRALGDFGGFTTKIIHF